MDALDTEEAVGNGRAGIARGGHENIDQIIMRTLILLSKIPEQSRHETGTDILEGKGGAVKEFQTIYIILNLDYRTVEGKGVVDDILKGVKVDVVAKESTGHIVGNLLERHVLDVVEENLR